MYGAEIQYFSDHRRVDTKREVEMKSIKLTLDVIPVRLSNELIMGRLTRTIRFVSSQDSSSFDLFDTHPNFDEIWEQAVKIIHPVGE